MASDKRERKGGFVPAWPRAGHPRRARSIWAAAVAQQFARHARGDWGDLDAHDRAANKGALQIGARIFSSYRMPDGEKLWIITEADRSSTTALLPGEY